MRDKMVAQNARFEQQQTFYYMFLGRFKAHRMIMSTSMGLMSIKQREAKSLQDCVKRFHVATLNTKNLEDQWPIKAFTMGV
ncbi:hypothetical protein J1N35_041350 [Gossypium stocksii]|uniref:Uncharacterized protein n=1 Tax=Gossypium stocksii TaxID=47602 RepID=A0A9D3UFN9_9ROSI|nr:hypothetical protein J1N35_041350 [Gossypium stocksii]